MPHISEAHASYHSIFIFVWARFLYFGEFVSSQLCFTLFIISNCLFSLTLFSFSHCTPLHVHSVYLTWYLVTWYFITLLHCGWFSYNFSHILPSLIPLKNCSFKLLSVSLHSHSFSLGGPSIFQHFPSLFLLANNTVVIILFHFSLECLGCLGRDSTSTGGLSCIFRVAHWPLVPTQHPALTCGSK